ncbi:MAG: hypothetical protein IJU69_02320 [Bacteroidales bacterium]|nr:hypothetical protein [Bacteroidales bacterium]
MTYGWIINFLGRVPWGASLCRAMFGFMGRKKPVELFGVKFSSQVGLGAGSDIDGENFKILSQLGASFAEIGPLSPENVNKALGRIIERDKGCIPAVNVTKSPKSKEDSEIINDYFHTFSLSYDFAEMFIIDCKYEDFNLTLMQEIMEKTLDVRFTCDKYKPMLLGIGDTMSDDDLDALVDYARLGGFDGIVAKGLDAIKHISAHTKGRFPIIGYGNVSSPAKALEMLENGASMVALTTEINDKGLGYVNRILRFLDNERRKEKSTNGTKTPA